MTPTSKSTRWLAVLGATIMAIPLGGCDEFAEFEPYRARRDSVTVAVGDSVRHNKAIQTIDPWPKHAWNTEIGLDGQRALVAADRYRQNKVLEPKGLTTQSISTGGSGGSPAAK